MTVKVLVVDDSAVIRGLITKALEDYSALELVGSASNGQMAIDMAKELHPDVIILDIEMPVMDGLTALPLLIKELPDCRVLIASTLTQENAATGVKALTLGAADYIGKPSSREPNDVVQFYKELARKVLALGGVADDKAEASMSAPAVSTVTAPSPSVQPGGALVPHGAHALAIASSTGGPQALLTLFTNVGSGLTGVPVFITQHMPANFTRILAEHLAKVTKRPCAEAIDGEVVKPGHIYLAPGDFHMVADRLPGGDIVIRLNKDEPENFCRPAADPMLRSLSKVYGEHLAALVLTGMGHDGMRGCMEVVAKGGGVVAQDESTSTVYGMPKAVAEKQICKAILPLPQIARYLIEQIDGKK